MYKDISGIALDSPEESYLKVLLNNATEREK